MNTMNTDRTSPRTPLFPSNWTAQDLVDAVPRRVSELMTPELMDFDRDVEAANSVALSAWAFDWRRRDYLRGSDLHGFQVR
ncbi:hypothetical protein [Lysobacter fragariae]